TCIDQAFDRCKMQNDTGQIVLIWSIAHRLWGVGFFSNAELTEINGKVERCLRFEVNFDSQITETNPLLVFFQHVRAVVPVRLVIRNDDRYLLTGQGTNQFLLATITPQTDVPCTFTTERQDAEFEVGNLSLGAPQRDKINVSMVYSPGFPLENDIEDCAVVGREESGFESLWRTVFAG